MIGSQGAADHSRSRNASSRSTAAGRFSRPKPIRKWFPGWPNCEPGRSRTPSASTSRAANASIGLVAEQPREPDRTAARPDPREAVGATLEQVVEDREVVGDDPRATGRGPGPAPGGRSAPGSRTAPTSRSSCSPSSARSGRAGRGRASRASRSGGRPARTTSTSRPSRCRARRGRRPRSAARRRRARGSDRPRRRGGGSRDRRRRRRGGPTPRGSGACPSGCAAR